MGIYGDRALELQREGFSCAQSVVGSLCELHDGKFKCRDLLGHDASKEEELSYILENNLYEKICQRMVHDGADMIYELLEGAPSEKEK